MSYEYINNFKRRAVKDFEKNLSIYMPAMYRYVNKSGDDVFSLPPETKVFYCALISFCNNDLVAKAFKNLKASAVSEPVYHKGFWHTKDGYLEEENEDYALFAQQIKTASNNFTNVLVKSAEQGIIFNFEDFIKYNLCVLDELKEKYSKTETEDMSLYEYFESELIISLTEEMEKLIYQDQVFIFTGDGN